jgi:uncharacterized protein YdhG (YjbR/CyaY superfamily)
MNKPDTVEAYFKTLPTAARDTLQELRATLHELLPDATEGLYYGMPMFKLMKPVVAYAAFKEHCSLFPLSAATLDELGNAADKYRTSKGTMQFPLGGKLPKSLLQKIVNARLAEIAAGTRSKAAPNKRSVKK